MGVSASATFSFLCETSPMPSRAANHSLATVPAPGTSLPVRPARRRSSAWYQSALGARLVRDLGSAPRPPDDTQTRHQPHPHVRAASSCGRCCAWRAPTGSPGSSGRSAAPRCCCSCSPAAGRAHGMGQLLESRAVRRARGALGAAACWSRSGVFALIFVDLHRRHGGAPAGQALAAARLARLAHRPADRALDGGRPALPAAVQRRRARQPGPAHRRGHPHRDGKRESRWRTRWSSRC